ncbi:glycosyltransferase [Microbacterium sp. ASV49]|uniref:Glycosyltransferase n=1 Tax=Microbacterium candidum TaxID=3041922 RepID=A0ABT7N0V0_9MICO|nr:glycosyltransferase [Microbacterium sp. ASV49]MDL9980295.1 glycosyltransferase [Microbacterium sp. ASV49]
MVTAHAEGRLLRPTLRSVSAAVAMAVSSGIRSEILIVCDNADARTIAEAQRWSNRKDLDFDVRTLEVSLGESGASRNAGAIDARGQFIGFVDGDDLVSENYFAAALDVLRARQSTVVHPEYVISFGARSVIWRTDSTDNQEVSYRDLVRHNLWPSSAVAARSLYLELPYRSLHPGSGYGPEDWTWNIDTAARGITHVVAPDSVFFYRVRERGGVNNRHALSMLPAFDLEGLRRALPLVARPPVPAEEASKPDGLRGLGHRAYRAVLPAARWSTGWLSFEAKHAIYRGVRWVFRLGAGEPPIAPPPPAMSPALEEALSAIVEIEPAASWTALQVHSLPVWHAHDDGYAEWLERALNEIGTRGQVLVMVPWLGVGGADLVSLNYAKALNSLPAYSGRVTILATFPPERTRRDLIPDSINVVNLDERWLALDQGMRNRFIAQLIVLARPELIVSVNCFHFSDALQTYARPILDETRAFVTLFAFDRIGNGYPTNPITDDSQRDYLDLLDGVITDNTATAALIEDILALPHERIVVHRQPAMDDIPALETETAAYRDEEFSSTHPFRLLWPHRLDGEKRPDVLIELTAELRRRDLPAVIEVWGQRVLTQDGDTLMHDLAEAGVIYRGPYSGGLAALATNEYHALLLTSQSEGLPLVLVQSMLLGLPVIASDVGGVSNIVITGETGILTRGPDDIAGYAQAVETLIQDPGLRRTLITGAHAFAAENHSWSAFDAAVERTVRPSVAPENQPALQVGVQLPHALGGVSPGESTTAVGGAH